MLWKIKKKMDLFWKSSNSWIFHPLLTENCWQLLPQIYIFAIFVKVHLSNFGQITNHLWQLWLSFLFTESAGIIHHSKSPWAFPLHMVPKKDRSCQPCGDYRHLNLVTTPDKYPLPKNARPFQWLAWLQRFFKLVRLVADIKCVENVPKDLIGQVG